MKNRIKVVPFVLLCFLVSTSMYAQRVKYNFNSDWKLNIDSTNASNPTFDDSKWKAITLPHAWNEDEAFKIDIHKHSTAIVWYRKHFKIPTQHQNQKVFIEFEGVRQGGEVFVNGNRIGLHENGVMAFGFDITQYVKFGNQENVIAVRTDNDWKYHEKESKSGFQWNDKNFNANYGGLPKNVYLHVSDKLYQTLPLYSFLQTSGVYVYAKDFDIKAKTAVINTESEIRNENSTPKTLQYQVSILDNGKKIAQFDGGSTTIAAGETKIVKAASKVANLHFWSWGYGYLYDVVTSLVVDGKVIDEVRTRTGFRKTEFKNGMIYLNDRVIQMKGYAQRTSNEWPAVGLSVPAWLSDYSNGLMVKGNGNYVRWMHVTPWKQDIESCDRVGLIESMQAGDSEKDVTGRRWEQRTMVMRDAIIYNRNNPSILFYESGNESISEEHMQEMKDIRNKYDANGGRAIGSREMLDSKVAEYGGEMLYINKSAHIPLFATEYSRDEGNRKYWDDFTPPYHKDAPAYNRNQDSHAIENVKAWYDYYRERPGTGKRVSSGGANIIFSDSNTHFRGDDNYRRSGEVDALRIEKEGFFAHEVMWDGWVDIEKYRTHIIGHWNYEPTVTKDISVVSSGEKVELFINGKSKGFGERRLNFLFTFKNIKFEEGTIKAISYDSKGKTLSQDEKKTVGKPVALKLSVMNNPNGFKADGADLALIQVEVVDKDGNRCPTAMNTINFSLDGQAEWRGGIAKGAEDNYILNKTFPVECGINRALIRSTTKAGKIKITAQSDGLTTATLNLETKPFKVKDGLTTELVSDKLPSNLERGETPLTPSYKVSRVAVDITKATSSVNQENLYKSYDDNELSEWTNDGKLATGWVKYELAKEAVLTEMCVKFTGWRMRSYSIQVLVDGVEVFKDSTSRSLGYVTLPLKPHKGKTVTVQLFGASSESDAFNQIVEVTGQKELDMYKDKNAGKSNGQLRIVEIEFYEKPKE